MFRHRTLGESLINWFSCAILALTILVALIALFTNDNSAEAAIGSFQSTSFDEGWVLEKDGQTEEITLPYAPEAEIGELVTMKNTLPDDIADQSSLLTRASMEDIFIYIDGKFREQYATEAIPDMAYHIPSAYVVATLNSEDSGKEIVIQVRIKARGVLNEVKLSPGNNAWFEILFRNLPVNIIAFIVLVMGLILLVLSIIMQRSVVRPALVFYLSLLMIDMAVWVFSESAIRQIIFRRPSLSQYFSYTAVELIGVLACLYFDEVQHRVYHKKYIIAEALSIALLLVNLILHFYGNQGVV